MRFSIGVAAVAIVLGSVCVSRADERTPLPAPYSNYSHVDILKTIFPSYNTRDHTVSELKNDDRTSAAVEWADARTWIVDGSKFLAVVASASVHSGYLCGTCPRRFHLSLLESANGRLRVIASGISQEFGGHRVAALDLAPYRLNDREILLGLRISHVWWMAQEFNEVLELYRVTKPHIDLVFRTLATDREYQYGMTGPVLSKRVTTVAIDKAEPYNGLVVVQRFYRCRNDFEGAGKTRTATGDCSVDANTSEVVWKDVTYWKFVERRFLERTEWEQALYSGGN